MGKKRPQILLQNILFPEDLLSVVRHPPPHRHRPNPCEAHFRHLFEGSRAWGEVTSSLGSPQWERHTGGRVCYGDSNLLYSGKDRGNIQRELGMRTAPSVVETRSSEGKISYKEENSLHGSTYYFLNPTRHFCPCCKNSIDL